MLTTKYTFVAGFTFTERDTFTLQIDLIALNNNSALWTNQTVDVYVVVKYNADPSLYAYSSAIFDTYAVKVVLAPTYAYFNPVVKSIDKMALTTAHAGGTFMYWVDVFTAPGAATYYDVEVHTPIDFGSTFVNGANQTQYLNLMKILWYRVGYVGEFVYPKDIAGQTVYTEKVFIQNGSSCSQVTALFTDPSTLRAHFGIFNRFYLFLLAL